MKSDAFTQNKISKHQKTVWKFSLNDSYLQYIIGNYVLVIIHNNVEIYYVYYSMTARCYII